MRNKILSILWMLVGALAGFWIGAIPTVIIFKVLRHFVGSHSQVLGLIGIIEIISVALVASWFKRLFYKGMLWGHMPDKDS
jgi:multisubunit Na+/H+ antiporter MnhE subunit